MLGICLLRKRLIGESQYLIKREIIPKNKKMKDSERPEFFFRRLVWKNSGILCLATLITLPIILGVAIGYLIVVVFMISYRKITGKKSRQEKESEASKKMRLILMQNLLDTAYTKPEELPGQKPRAVRELSSYGSVNDSLLSTDENELESETQTEDEEGSDGENLTGNKIEDEYLRKNWKVCTEVEHASQGLYEKSCGDDLVDGNDGISSMTESRAVDQDVSRATSASSGHYSTASEMADRCDSRNDDTTVLDMGNYGISGGNALGFDMHEKLEKSTDVPKNDEKSIFDVAKLAINESGFFEEKAPAVRTMKLASSFVSKEAEPVKESNILSSSLYSERVKTFNSNTHKHADIQSNSVLYSGLTESSKHSNFVNGGIYTAPAVSSPPSGAPTSVKSPLIGSQHSNIPPCVGKLKYCVHYLRDKNQLQVTIIKAINLFNHEGNERSPSSFVKVSLLPQRFCWQKTKVIEETSHPVFNETFVISGFSHERFSNYTLLITLVDARASFQGFYRDHVIGELYLPLCHVVMYSSNHEKVFSQWAELKPRVTEMLNVTKCGRINLALSYRPISGRLIVTVKKAKELECENKEQFEPYVKLALYCGGARVGRGTTRLKRKVTSPVFNEKFNFDLDAEQIAYTTLVLKMMNNIDSTSSSCCGMTVIGYESSGNGQEHWLNMMKYLSKHVDVWHDLYS